jgi:hypothetical protein
MGAFAPALRVLAPMLHDVTQFVWRVTRRPICQHERRPYRAERSAHDLAINVGFA